MDSFLPFFLILLSGLFLSVVFRKYHVPWVITLILSGIIIGPFGLDLFETNETIDFISETGLVLLMFMAGLETKLSSFGKIRKDMYLLAFINGFFPLLIGFLISFLFNFDFVTSILVGIIFVSSSIAVVIPSLESNGLIETPLGSSVVATSILQDIASLVLLSLFLQSSQGHANLPLLFFYPLLILILIALRKFLPILQTYFMKVATDEEELFQRDIRAVLLILFGVVIIFELMGLHPIIAGFFAGLVLSESLQSSILEGKIRALSYGIFIPTFFIVVGSKTDFSILTQSASSIYLTITIVVGSALSKFISGSFGARLAGFNEIQSMFFGASSIPQLSTTLAATFTALESGIFSSQLAASMVALSLITTLVGPLLMGLFNKYLLGEKDIKKTIHTN